jgi:putative MFS transporter
MDRSQRTLFALLCTIIVFEGFDVALAAIVLPYVGSEFRVGADRAGRALGVAAMGAIAACFTIRVADRYGRRPVLLAAVTGFSAFSLATAFARSLFAFALLQFGARVLLVTQVTLAYILLAETLPPFARGRANGLMGAFGSIGGALPALLLGNFLSSGLGWRGMFAVGALPLVLVPLLARALHESPAFLVSRSTRGTSGRDLSGVRAQLAMLLGAALRRRFLGVSALWFLINFESASTMSFFTWYVVRERGWTPGQLALLAPLGLVLSFAGYALAGVTMDRLGRCRALISFLVVAILAAIVCYRAQGRFVIGGCYVLLQALQGVWPIAYVYTAELFTPDVRATAAGFASNLLGRWGQVLAPAAVGALAVRVGGTGAAIAPLALFALLAVPLLLGVLPETLPSLSERARTAGDSRSPTP